MSVNAAPVIAVAFVLVSVKVRTEATLVPTAEGAKAFVTTGRASTVKIAEAPAAVPALVVVTLPVELLYAPTVVEVTLTVIVHEPPAGTVPPVSATLAALFAAVSAPPHVETPLADAVFTRPTG